MSHLCIDIGGTSIKGGVFLDNKLIDTYSYKTNGHSFDLILKSINRVVNHFLNKYQDISFIGVSSAGDIDYKHGYCVYASNNLNGFTKFDIKKYFEDNYHLPTYVNNDAVCHLLGNLKNDNLDKNIFLITLGTGVGAVLYKDNEIFYGEDFNLGKFAHYELVHDGYECDCGKKGCAEKEISSYGLLHDALKISKNIKSCKDIFLLYKVGDLKAKKILDEYFNKVNRYLTYIFTLGVDEVIIGGGLTKSRDIFRKYILDKRIKFSEHGSLAALYGANYLICNRYDLFR